jgi:hypothetical protein
METQALPYNVTTGQVALERQGCSSSSNIRKRDEAIASFQIMVLYKPCASKTLFRTSFTPKIAAVVMLPTMHEPNLQR